jgi:hypothetical protein
MLVRELVACVLVLAGLCAHASGQGCTGPRFAFTRALSPPAYLRLLDQVSMTSCGEISLPFTPAGVKVRPNGNIFVWAQTTGPLNEYDRNSGALVRTVAAAGAGGSDLNGRDIEFTPDGSSILVAGSGSNRVGRFRVSDGAYLGNFVLPGAGGLSNGFAMTFGPNDDLFVASNDTHQVLEYNGTTGSFVRVFVAAGAGGLAYPYDVVFGPDGNLYVTARDQGAVYRYNGVTGAPLGQFNQTLVPPARGLAFGPNGNLFVCAWGGPSGGGVYEFNGQSGAMVGLAAAGSGAIFLSFECTLSLTQQPSSHTATAQQSTSFSVQSQGTGNAHYQWRKNGSPLTDGPRIAGCSTSTLAINPVFLGDAGTYDVVVTNGCTSVTSGQATLTVVCFPNCDNSTAPPILNVADFTCFLSRYAVGDSYANCDGSTAAPALNVADFTCFLQKYAAGCP